MRYVKAETMLPDNLVKEIQKYVQGQYIYISLKQSKQKKWGEKSGSKEYIRNRNEDIRNKYKSGYAIVDLAEEFFSFHSQHKKNCIYKKQVSQAIILRLNDSSDC